MIILWYFEVVNTGMFPGGTDLKGFFSGSAKVGEKAPLFVIHKPINIILLHLEPDMFLHVPGVDFPVDDFIHAEGLVCRHPVILQAGEYGDVIDSGIRGYAGRQMKIVHRNTGN
jgi:hypothetical protein